MNPRKPDGVGRRQFLKASAATALAGAAIVAGETCARDGAMIVEENRRPGTTDWQLTRVRLGSHTGVRAFAIEGYCTKQSVLAGDSIGLCVSVNPATKFTVEIFRTGYYDGRGGRLMTTLGPFDGKKQPDPVMGAKRLMECRWEPNTTLTIPVDWPSGVYLGRLTTVPEASDKPYWQSYVVFVVRDTRRADILFQCSDNTWQAYNKWPESTSLYTDPRGSHARGVAVSFDRPYGRQSQFTAILDDPLEIGAGEGLSFEFPLYYWLEQHGYDVTYCSNSDCIDAAQITRCKAFLSVGHDEYWDLRQHDAVKTAIESGVNALWLSGNACFGVSPLTASSDGREKRIIERIGHYSGVPEEDFIAEEKTFTKDYKRLGPDESLIIGARTVTPANGGGDWTCAQPDHWIFEGTGMKKGDSIPGLVGWEHHGAPAKIPGLEVLAEGMVWSGGVRPSHYTATIFPGPKGNFVFNAASIFWSQGLSSPPGHMLPWSHWSRPHGPDDRVQRITQNVLRRAVV